MRLRFEAGESIGSTVEVEADEFTIGRERDCDLVLSDPEVSRRHARLTRTPDGMMVEDLGSTNGTQLDGETIEGRHLVRGGERLRVGDTIFVLEAGADEGTDRTVMAARPRPPAAAPPPRPASGQPQRAPQPAAAQAHASPERSQSRIQSTLDRMHLKRSVQRAFVLAGASLALVVIVIVLVVAGVIGGDDDDKAPTVAEVVEQVTPSTALVISDKDGERLGSGSGWVLDAPAGLVVTNNHVVNGGDAFRVDVGGRVRPATVVAAAPCEDMAVLRVKDIKGLTTLPLGSQAEMRPGQPVVAVGYPANASLRDNLSSTAGVISVVRSSFRFPALDVPVLPNVVQTDAAINPGNSGGPLVDLEGRLVGMNTAGFDEIGGRTIQGEGYAIGVDRLRQMLPGLRAGKSISWTGMGLDYTTAEALSEQGLPRGLLVTNAVPGTPAAKAGFGESTVLISAVDGRALDVNLQSYCTAVRGIESGQEAVFHVIHSGGEAQDVRVPFQ